MNDREAENSAKSKSMAAYAAVIFLVVVLALWGHRRGMFGHAFAVIRGVEQLAPQAEERNHLIDELARQPISEKPK